MAKRNKTEGEHLQQKIETISNDLAKALEDLKATHTQELLKLKEHCVSGIQNVACDVENQWANFNHRHVERMLELEEQISYLKELTHSQRLMMEGQVAYIKELENKNKDQS